jgi:integrase
MKADCTKQSPAYLVHTPYSWCFRLIVPLPLRWVVGKRELRYSLKTGAIGVAKRKARFLAGKVQFIFQLLQKGWQGMGELTQDQIQQLVDNYIKKSIADMDNLYDQGIEIPDSGGDSAPPFSDPEGFNSYINEPTGIREDLIYNLNRGDFSMLEKAIDAFLKASGIDQVDKTSPEYRKLCVEIHKAETKLLPIKQQHMRCDFSYREQLPALFPGVFAAPKEERPPERREEEEPRKDKRKPVELSKVFKEYWEWKEPQLKKDSATEYKRAIELFLEFAGEHKDIGGIDGEMLEEWQQRLGKEKVKGGKKRKPVTVKNKYIIPVQGFFGYAVKRKYITLNPVDYLLWKKEPKGKRPEHKRTRYSIEELRKIFCQSPEYTEDKTEEPFQFWVPLICLYTGMRIGEVCQLYITDFRKIDGVWCLDVNEDTEDKTVKNSEPRMVPLHPFLIKDLNFVGFVQSLPDQEGRIFHELSRYKNPTDHAGVWFSKFKERCGIVGVDGSKASHAFRYTVQHQLYKKEVFLDKVKMFVGHKLPGGVTPHYAGEFEPGDLYEKVVLNLDYGLDLSHLKDSKWVVR